MPRLLLVARAHALSPSTLVKRVLLRRIHTLREWLTSAFWFVGLQPISRKFGTPSAGFGVPISAYRYRNRMSGRPQQTEVPMGMVAITTGILAELYIKDVFPRMVCFVHVDFDTFAIRWSRLWFISLHALEGVQLRGLSTVLIMYSGLGGVLQVLELHMAEQQASEWVDSLRALFPKHFARIASPAHWRWALSCMAATSKRGATGVLLRSELRSLMVCANASARMLSNEALEQVIESAEVSEQRLVPAASKSTPGMGHQQTLLNAQQACLVLLELSTSSQEISRLHNRYARADHGLVDLDGWLSFTRTEQLAQFCGVSTTGPAETQLAEAEMAWAERQYEAAVPGGSAADKLKGMGLLQFALELLGSHNDAVASPKSPTNEPPTSGRRPTFSSGWLPSGAMDMPLAQYWCSSSHNTYCVGDQLTGMSSPDMYRRQLLCGLRHVEVDCWNLRDLVTTLKEDTPVVTHGHTLCTIAPFGAIAKAIADCAFTTSKLPVTISLEQHCSHKQQHSLAEMIVEHMGETLLTYEELVSTGRTTSLSPLELSCRVLVKGKVKPLKPPKEKKGTWSGRLSRQLPGRLSRRQSELPGCLSPQLSASGIPRSTPDRDSRRSSDTPSACDSCHILDTLSGPQPAISRQNAVLSDEPPDLDRRDSESDLGHTVDLKADAERRLVNKYRKKNKSSARTDEYYKAQITMRSLAVPSFLAVDLSSIRSWALGIPITSINEDKLLRIMRVSQVDRNHIEGLSSMTMRGGVGLTEEQVSSRALVQLAADPPAGVAKLQRRTHSLLLRPYPLGLRFSGNNMSPLPGWLAGAQCVCLNFSAIDLPAQLHFALFDGTSGYVLKPPEMRVATQVPELDHPGDGQERQSNALADERCRQMPGSLRRPAYEAQPSVPNIERGSFDVDAVRTTTSSAITGEQDRSDNQQTAGFDEDNYWPFPREQLHRMSIRILSLHGLPKRGEQRPHLKDAWHAYHRELSGKFTPPNHLKQSAPELHFSIHPIGGFCAISSTLPVPPQNIETEISLSPRDNGMNAEFGDVVHCVVAEPHAVFLHVTVIDHLRRSEVAYTSAVLGRLRHGYRVLCLRSMLGTRIELCCLFVHVSVGCEESVWATPRHQRHQLRQQCRVTLALRERLTELEAILVKRPETADQESLAQVSARASAARASAALASAARQSGGESRLLE
mmetsp:Transcript_14795/g.39537  ORF Transcript_14795/g.39537 Transcript_14795/m.39537 type:complete len:1181 (+) Transcript_14795:3770-7312(+)